MRCFQLGYFAELDFPIGFLGFEIILEFLNVIGEFDLLYAEITDRISLLLFPGSGFV